MTHQDAIYQACKIGAKRNQMFFREEAALIAAQEAQQDFQDGYITQEEADAAWAKHSKIAAQRRRLDEKTWEADRIERSFRATSF